MPNLAECFYFKCLYFLNCISFKRNILAFKLKRYIFEVRINEGKFLKVVLLITWVDYSKLTHFWLQNLGTSSGYTIIIWRLPYPNLHAHVFKRMLLHWMIQFSELLQQNNAGYPTEITETAISNHTIFHIVSDCNCFFQQGKTAFQLSLTIEYVNELLLPVFTVISLKKKNRNHSTNEVKKLTCYRW